MGGRAVCRRQSGGTPPMRKRISPWRKRPARGTGSWRRSGRPPRACARSGGTPARYSWSGRRWRSKWPRRARSMSGCCIGPSPARMLVTELMVLCNSLMADFCRREGLPAAYRYQDQPEVDELVPEAAAVDKAGASPVHLYRMMQRLPPAGLSTTPAAHRGLGVPAYIQVTSPLRRYPDLVMQRQISHYLSTGLPLYPPETVASVAQRAEVQLREIGRLEADRRRYWFLKYLAQSHLAGADPGDTNALFQAVVLDHPPGRHALLELSEYPFRLRAEVDRSRGPGDTVSLRLHEVDLWRRVARFVQERTA